MEEGSGLRRGLLPGGVPALGGGVPAPGGAWSGGSALGGACSWGVPAQGVPAPGGSGRGVPGGGPQMATAAGSTHPSGMHSCFFM